jgi:murein DD-endopeptidase MepM/ murein hydrolase activator NlpD
MPSSQSSGLGRWLLAGLILALVAGISYLPLNWAETWQTYLAYCFKPNAAEGTPLAAWLDWQPISVAITTFWSSRGGDSEGLAYPCAGQIVSGYQYRYHPVTGQLGMHYGIDIRTDADAAVQAAGAGMVKEVATDASLGLYLIIDHGQGIETKYAHLQEVLVEVGEEVQKGQTVARAGQTGVIDGVHVHFEILVDGTPVDPIPKLENPRR